MVDAEEFEPPLAEFPHQAHDLLGRNFVIPDWISRDVLRRIWDEEAAARAADSARNGSGHATDESQSVPLLADRR